MRPGYYRPEPTARRMYRYDLESKVERMVEDGEIEPEEADDYYREKLGDWDDEYGDMMYDAWKNGDFDE